MHFLPPLVAAVAMFVIGGIWYSVFARFERRALAPETSQGGEPPVGALLQSFLINFVIALIFQRLFYFVHTPSALHGVHAALLICLATVVASKYSQKLFRQGTWTLFFIDSGYWLVSFATMGAILGGWKTSPRMKRISRIRKIKSDKSVKSAVSNSFFPHASTNFSENHKFCTGGMQFLIARKSDCAYSASTREVQRRRPAV